MMAVRRILAVLVVCVVVAPALLVGCNDDDNRETYYMYITNGYPGSESLTLYGPEGELVSNLGFGDSTAEPVEVNRNVNSDDFILVIDGAPTPMELMKSSFSLYPQETATLMISRRAGEDDAEATLYRHSRSPDPDCMLTLGNSLSLDEGMTGDAESFAYQTEWKTEPEPSYDPDYETLAETRCGPTEVPDQFQRDDVHAEIADDPWFFPVQADARGGLQYKLVWAVRRPDPRTGDMRSEGITHGGTIRAVRDTEDYMDCLSGAVTMAEDEEEDAQNGGEAQDECPDLTETAQGPEGEVPVVASDEVVWDVEAANQCAEYVTYSGFPVAPAQPDTYVSFIVPANADVDPDSPEACGQPIRVRTPHRDVIFQNADETVEGFLEDEGGFVSVDTRFPISEQRFFVLFGRPVNPFVAQWNSEETAVGLDEHPYPNEATPHYDDD